MLSRLVADLGLANWKALSRCKAIVDVTKIGHFSARQLVWSRTILLFIVVVLDINGRRPYFRTHLVFFDSLAFMLGTPEEQAQSVMNEAAPLLGIETFSSTYQETLGNKNGRAGSNESSTTVEQP